MVAQQVRGERGCQGIAVNPAAGSPGFHLRDHREAYVLHRVVALIQAGTKLDRVGGSSPFSWATQPRKAGSKHAQSKSTASSMCQPTGWPETFTVKSPAEAGPSWTPSPDHLTERTGCPRYKETVVSGRAGKRCSAGECRYLSAIRPFQLRCPLERIGGRGCLYPRPRLSDALSVCPGGVHHVRPSNRRALVRILPLGAAFCNRSGETRNRSHEDRRVGLPARGATDMCSAGRC